MSLDSCVTPLQDEQKSKGVLMSHLDEASRNIGRLKSLLEEEQQVLLIDVCTIWHQNEYNSLIPALFCDRNSTHLPSRALRLSGARSIKLQR